MEITASNIENKLIQMTEITQENQDKILLMIMDLETNPYFDKTDDEIETKYTFYHVDLKCQVKRNPMGSWLGYVEYDLTEEQGEDIEIHGGITYNDGTVVGFDCCHWDDITPMDVMCGSLLWGDQNTYKDLGYVVEETKRLAETLASL